MTQLQTMSDQELDEWLAVNCMGWREEEHPEVNGTGQWMAEYEFPVYFKPDGSFVVSSNFSPSTDPADSLEVQAKAIEVSADKYVSNLDKFRNPEPIQEAWGNHEIARLLTSTPRERAEAAYMTLQADR